MDPLPSLLFILIFVLLSAFFSSCETAFSSLNKVKLKTLAGEKNKRAKFALKLADDFDNVLFAILIGNNIVNIATASISTVLFINLMKSNAGIATTLSTIVTTIVLLVFGEVTPKTMAKMSPEKFAMNFSYVLYFFIIILYPLSLVFHGWKWLIVKIFKLKQEEGITEEELITIVEEAGEGGTLDNNETHLIRSAIEFNDLDVGDILVPRVNVIAIEKNTAMGEIKGLFAEHTFSRLPVYDGTIDNVIGMLLEKDFYVALENKQDSIDGYIKKIAYATEHMKISVLLKSLQKQKIHMAVVVDEYGGMLGIVTLEDILEELVGEIYDEHDEVVEYFSKVSDNVYVVNGNAEIDDFLELFSLEEDDTIDANTVGGFVVDKLGNLPKVNDTFTYQNLIITVTKVQQARVTEVKAEIVEAELDEDD